MNIIPRNARELLSNFILRDIFLPRKRSVATGMLLRLIIRIDDIMGLHGDKSRSAVTET